MPYLSRIHRQVDARESTAAHVGADPTPIAVPMISTAAMIAEISFISSFPSSRTRSDYLSGVQASMDSKMNSLQSDGVVNRVPSVPPGESSPRCS